MLEIESSDEMNNKNAYTVNIPNIVNGKQITEIGEGLFAGINVEKAWNDYLAGGIWPEYLYLEEPNMRIKSVNIPEGIKKIYSAYDGFDPENRKYYSDVENGSFIFSLNLSSISFSSTLIEIGNMTFYYNNLTHINLPSSIKKIGSYAFAYNEIFSLIIPSSVEEINEGIFYGSSLTSLTFAGTSTDGSGIDTSNLNRIASYAFDVSDIDHIIYLPSSLTNVGYHAFHNCSTCSFYINHLLIPETFDSAWAGDYTRKYILNGNGGYTCIENCN